MPKSSKSWQMNTDRRAGTLLEIKKEKTYPTLAGFLKESISKFSHSDLQEKQVGAFMSEFSDIQDPLMVRLKWVIKGAVRVLAILMTAVILWGVVDVGWVVYQKLITPPLFLLTINDILATFGAFMAVLIAIEIFININIYLRDDVIHVKIVMATALMAIARKVIILDFDNIAAEYVFAIAAVVLAMSIGYLLVMRYTCGENNVIAIDENADASVQNKKPGRCSPHNDA